MPQSPHDRAAEYHNKAAHAHEAAATAHGKGDHLTAHELSKQAHEYSTKAFEHSKEAAGSCSKAARKQYVVAARAHYYYTGFMLRVPYDDLYAALLPRDAAAWPGVASVRLLCARLFAETTRDGVYTHGLNRFPRFAAIGCERQRRCQRRADQDGGRWGARTLGWASRGWQSECQWLPWSGRSSWRKQHGIGGVALANTNHWMRGGHLWMAGGGARALCDLLDQHAGQSAGVGSDDADAGKQSADHCGAAAGRARRSGYGDVAVFVWNAGGVQQTRATFAGGWRFRCGG